MNRVAPPSADDPMRHPCFLSALAAALLAAPHARSEPKMPPTLTRAQASAFARLALKGVRKEYPNKPGVVLSRAEDVKAPRAWHPAFYGSFDRHSSVHGHWM